MYAKPDLIKEQHWSQGFPSAWGPYGGHRGRLYEVWEGYGDPMWVIGGHLYEVWGTYGDHGGSFI